MIDKTYLYQINVTRDCNLRCTHCYIHSDVKRESKKMIEEQIMLIGKGIVEHMKKINYSRAEIHFVGGEPTMLGKDFFNNCLPKFKELVKSQGFSAEVMMISNLIGEDLLEIAQHFDRVTTSYEVDSRFVSLKGKYKPALELKWSENLKMLISNGVDVGITTAITKPVIKYGARRILDYFYDLGVKQVHFGFFIPEGDGLINKNFMFPEFVETSNFLIETAEWYLEKREQDKNLWVNPFESMLSAIHKDEPLDDIVCPIVSGSMDINWDGSAATCLEAGGGTMPEWLGNVFTESISDIATSKEFMKKVFMASKPQKVCLTCDEYKVCKSGCGVLFQYYNPSLDEDCPGFKKFIKYVRQKHSEGLIPKYTKYIGKGC